MIQLGNLLHGYLQRGLFFALVLSDVSVCRTFACADVASDVVIFCRIIRRNRWTRAGVAGGAEIFCGIVRRNRLTASPRYLPPLRFGRCAPLFHRLLPEVPFAKSSATARPVDTSLAAASPRGRGIVPGAHPAPARPRPASLRAAPPVPARGDRAVLHARPPLDHPLGASLGLADVDVPLPGPLAVVVARPPEARPLGASLDAARPDHVPRAVPPADPAPRRLVRASLGVARLLLGAVGAADASAPGEVVAAVDGAFFVPRAVFGAHSSELVVVG
mmetsp:Transcript_22062/g.47346  ORF Transcript_22062/g.47346 Transcript_22062/m.47346 type:complete len:275 (+) Transcript_22062:489-1313(+)